MAGSGTRSDRLPAGTRTCCTRSKSLTGMARALPPLTETVAVQPESHATERITVDGRGRLQPDVLGLGRAGHNLHGQPPAVPRRGHDGFCRLAQGEHRIALGEPGQLPRPRDQRRRQASPPARRDARPPRSPPAARGANRSPPGPTVRWPPPCGCRVRHRAGSRGHRDRSAPARRPVRPQRSEPHARARAGGVLQDEGGALGLQRLPVEPGRRLAGRRAPGAGPDRRGRRCR